MGSALFLGRIHTSGRVEMRHSDQNKTWPQRAQRFPTTLPTSVSSVRCGGLIRFLARLSRDIKKAADPENQQP